MAVTLTTAARNAACDAIVDLIETGSTLAANRLRVLTDLGQYESVLIQNTAKRQAESQIAPKSRAQPKKPTVARTSIARISVTTGIRAAIRRAITAPARYPARLAAPI